MTLFEFGKKIEAIREAADSVEIRGSDNCQLISYIVDSCNGLIDEVNNAIRQVSGNMNEEEEGDPSGGNDSAKPEQD